MISNSWRNPQPEIRNLVVNGIIIVATIMLSFLANRLEWGDILVSCSAILALIPLSLLVSICVEKIAVVTGATIGGLLNALLGNITELIIAIIALKQGLIDLVKSSITGSILSDFLILMGLAMLVGGIRYKEQEFKPILAKINGAFTTLAIIAIAIPSLLITTSNLVSQPAILQLSIIIAIILIIIYCLTLLFSLKTHAYLYDVGTAKNAGDEFSNSDRKIYVISWSIILFLSTIAVAYEADLFVGVIESLMQKLQLTPLFTGVVLIPLLSDLGGIITVIRLALDNQMDLTVAATMGDGLLVSLFVTPVLILAGVWFVQPMSLNFNPFEVIALVIAISVTNLISSSGKSNWLDGVLLLATYLILGVAFYYHPA